MISINLIKKTGKIEFVKKAKGSDRLYVEGLVNYYTINDKSILPNLEASQNFGTTKAFSNSRSDINKIFMAGAHFTNFEFQKGTLKDGSFTQWEAEQISMGFKYIVQPSRRGMKGNSDAATKIIYENRGFHQTKNKVFFA